jgi:FHA domain-containing protein
VAPRLDKPCGTCGAGNPAAAKFCFDCGTAFPKAPPPEQAAARKRRPLTDDLAAQDDARGLAEAHARAADASAEAEAARAAAKANRGVPAPFAATLVVEGTGASFPLSTVENTIGGAGAHIELTGDRFVAPRVATVAFRGERLVLRDEGSINGVYLKVRESVAIAPGDSFIAGDRLFRFDGPAELSKSGPEGIIVAGAPRPRGACVRVSEVLAGGRAGRTCFRSGPVIAIGKAGCDLSFPSDTQLADRHAEIRLRSRGDAVLVDLGEAPCGVLLRVRTEAELQAGDVLRIGEQQFRLEM